MKQYTQRDLLKIIATYYTMDKKKLKQNFKQIKKVYNFQNRDMMEELGYNRDQVKAWFNQSSSTIPFFEDSLKIAEHFEFDIVELLPLNWTNTVGGELMPINFSRSMKGRFKQYA